MSSWRDRVNYLLASIIVFLLDQTTKKIVTQGMMQHESITVIPDFLNITYIHNRGAVFGLGSSVTSPYLSWGLSILSVVSLAVILVYFLRLNVRNPRMFFGLALVLGGALGNLYDRLLYGYVIDFIDLHWFEHHWPFFNIADMSICIGVGLLLISMSTKAEESPAPNIIEPGS
ncbi:signal peptidase II [bacterium]|nr:signal peptidase II [bacterium]